MAEPNSSSRHSVLADFHSPQAIRHRQWRHIKDVLNRYLMSFGGVSVIIAIVLIAFYLLYVVLPIFKPAQVNLITDYPAPGDKADATMFYALEEQHEIGLRINKSGQADFFKTGGGEVVAVIDLTAWSPAEVTAFASGDPAQAMLAVGLSDGGVILAQHQYRVTYPNDIRLITPSITYPFGPEPIIVDASGNALVMLAAQWDGEQATIAALTADSRLLLLNLRQEESLIEDEPKLATLASSIPVEKNISHIILDVDQRELYLADSDGYISYFDISNKTTPRLIQKVRAVAKGNHITSLEFLSGGISILVGDSAGRITQWFPVRAEYSRKGFVSIDANGYLGIYHTTAHRTIKLARLVETPLRHVAIAPRANAILAEDERGNVQFLDVANEHPEVSWQSIWGKVWYESRDRPEYIWQSSSASSDFEPKFSLTPLAFGTLKAAFYAMIFAIPLAILGAIYTAYFMAAKVRSMVKSTVEIMAALPTVILGFLAGLWFAPYVESHLPGMFLILVLAPFTVLAVAWCWQLLPDSTRARVPDGNEAILLAPVLVGSVILALWASGPLEVWLFDGNLPYWLRQEMGITYEQRNSLVVGIAIGFAVIPTIFSISEDAIFGVPKSLTTGSLALGATPWQTMVRVVLLTASPGIFSAIMIGLGRAVGETMIVVMATGNTAIMDMNIFQGFRALSANIAVEMPESEVGSTHFRVLFLAGLVLFFVTFVFNTIAELVRQRLRLKYSSL
ncbi:MAG: ABC transporter, inner rane subunit [Gammaproteobacteria bacterium]|nr:ABC transporter, inner rane subunit [Gammaproteobacteria bacterium]